MTRRTVLGVIALLVNSCAIVQNQIACRAVAKDRYRGYARHVLMIISLRPA